MDWIGTMEELSTVTMRLLSHMLLGNETKIADRQSGEIQVHNVQQKPNRLRLGDLFEDAIRRVKAATALDQELYDRLSRDFHLEQPEFVVSRPGGMSLSRQTLR